MACLISEISFLFFFISTYRILLSAMRGWRTAMPMSFRNLSDFPVGSAVHVAGHELPADKWTRLPNQRDPTSKGNDSLLECVMMQGERGAEWRGGLVWQVQMFSTKSLRLRKRKWLAERVQRDMCEKQLILIMERYPWTYFVHHGNLWRICFDWELNAHSTDSVDVLCRAIRTHKSRHLKRKKNTLKSIIHVYNRTQMDKWWARTKREKTFFSPRLAI